MTIQKLNSAITNKFLSNVSENKQAENISNNNNNNNNKKKKNTFKVSQKIDHSSFFPK